MASEPLTKPLTDERILAQIPAARARVHLHFAPTSSSWINLVECWFGILQRRALTRGAFRSTDAPEQTLRDDVAANNADPTPFVWTKAADDILASVSRFCQRTSGSHH